MLDLRNLETFVWVARLSGFHAAAERLNTTQPAISARIALLERDLGVRLFERRSRRIVLTSKGLELLAYAERMLTLRADILQTVADPSTARGLLRLGVPETIVHTWLPVLVERINAAYPAITLDIEVDSTPSLRAALLADTLDVAVLFAPIVEPTLRVRPLCAFPLAWLASTRLALPAGPIGLTELARWPIITFRRETAPYAAIRRLLIAANLPEARIFGSSSIAAMVRMALDGVGSCVLPQVAVPGELARHELRLLEVPHVITPIHFHICFKPKPDSYLAAAVAELAVEAVGAYAQQPGHRSKILIEDI